MTAIPTDDLIARLIDEAHEEKPDRPRPHLGASMLGHHCDRWLWLSYRWAVREKFSGRMLRLFRRGQNEEATIVDDLRAIGVEVVERDPRTDQQWRADFGAHVSGSGDGIAERGVPGATAKRHVLEFKTHNKKSFEDLQKHRLQKSKPMHYAQCQVYMLGFDIDRALYVGVCKDDDRIYTERVRFDAKFAGALVDRGRRITLSDRMPEPCPGAAPDWYLCKFCAAHAFCHGGEPTREVNCRTCAHSTSREDDWHCASWGATIPVDAQRLGCDRHVLHPDAVPWRRLPSDRADCAVYDVGGRAVENGPGGVSSRELVDAS